MQYEWFRKGRLRIYKRKSNINAMYMLTDTNKTEKKLV